MTMNEHDVLKNNCKHKQIYKEHQIYEILNMWSKLLYRIKSNNIYTFRMFEIK